MLLGFFAGFFELAQSLLVLTAGGLEVLLAGLGLHALCFLVQALCLRLHAFDKVGAVDHGRLVGGGR